MHTLNYLCCKHSGEIWVFAEGFFHTAPAWFTSNVDYRTITNARALQTGFECYHFAHAMHKVLVEGAGLRQRCREHCGAYSHVSMRTFFGYEQWNTQTGVLDGIFLNLIDCLGCEFWIQTVGEGFAGPRVGAEHCPERTERLLRHAVLKELRHFHLIAFFLIHRPTERAKQLSHFLIECHLREQDIHALVNAEGCILVAAVD